MCPNHLILCHFINFTIYSFSSSFKTSCLVLSRYALVFALGPIIFLITLLAHVPYWSSFLGMFIISAGKVTTGLITILYTLILVFYTNVCFPFVLRCFFPFPGKTIIRWTKRTRTCQPRRPAKRSPQGPCNGAKGRLIPLILPRLATRLPLCIPVRMPLLPLLRMRPSHLCTFLFHFILLNL